MKKLLFTIALIAVTVSFSDNAHAFFLVDTGEPVQNVGWNIEAPPGVENGMAAKFSVLDSVIITDIGAWFGSNPEIDGSGNGILTIALYGDNGGEIPSATELYSDQLSISTLSSFNSVSGLSWALGPGDYWVAFEGRPGDTYVGRIKGDFNGPGTSTPSPLLDEAQFFTAAYYEFDDYNIGLRIDAQLADDPNEPNPVIPEPMTMATLGAGLLSGFSLRKKRRT